MSSEVWPYPEPNFDLLEERGRPCVKAFLISPTKPIDHYKQLFQLIQDVGNPFFNAIGYNFKCYWAAPSKERGVIHREIWRNISLSDFIIVDVSGFNGNVMLELGVAAARRHLEHVILLRCPSIHKECGREEEYLFDIAPVRHFNYEITDYNSVKELQQLLFQQFETVMAYIPRTPSSPTTESEYHWTHKQGERHRLWRMPSFCHFAATEEGVEVGAPWYFDKSYIILHPKETHSAQVLATFRFIQRAEEESWVGIKVRTDYTRANWGHLFCVLDNGKIMRTVPDGLGGIKNDWLPAIDGMNCENVDTVLSVSSSDSGFKFDVKHGEHQSTFEFDATKLPYVFAQGLSIIQSYRTRFLLREVRYKT